MKAVLDFLSLPLSLPISPIWDFVICFVLGEIAYWVAFSLAGEIGDTSAERGCLHWLIRIPFYFILWGLACLIIIVVKFIKANLIWVLIALGALGVIGLLILLHLHMNRYKREQKHDEMDLQEKIE